MAQDLSEDFAEREPKEGAMMAALNVAPSIDLIGPSTVPGSPQITPAMINAAVNAALTSLFNAMVQFDSSGSLEVPGSQLSVGNGAFVVTIGSGGTTILATNLPNTDPHNNGQLWNNANLLAISAG